MRDHDAMSERAEFKAEVMFTMAMDDTSVAEAEEMIKQRVNEMLAVLERKDDVRILLVHQCDVSEQP